MSDTPTVILVVDDDELTAELTGMLLEGSGYDVMIALGGMDALEKMTADSSIKMIVSDMNMPMIDGVQLFTELREQGFNQPFVLLTGDEAEPLRLAHPALDGVLTKDENLQEKLSEMAENLLGRN